MKTRTLPTSLTAALMPASLALAEHLASELSDVMKSLHGGFWRVQIDHNSQFVIVVRDMKKGDAHV